MKKRVVSIILVLSMLVMFLPSNANALIAYAADSDFTIEDGVLTKYNGSGGDVVIPDGVTAIGAHAFISCSKLKSVKIPNSVTSIGYQAFCYCSGLQSVVIPNSVKSIDLYAFGDCVKLTSITVPSSVTKFEALAIDGCSGLANITVDSKNTNYSSSNGILYNKNKTTLVACAAAKHGTFTIPDSVTDIGEWAFNKCAGITSITIPNSVTKIGDNAFYKCTGITSMIIPSSVTSIEYGSFSLCTALSGITVDANNISYSSVSGILYNKSKTRLIRCPAGKIGTVTIPKTVTSIDAEAFYKCEGLTSITIPSSITSIGRDVFGCCSGLLSVTIPNSITNIGNSAFWYCTALTSITIPSSVTNIGSSAFSGCKSLAGIVVDSNNMYYSSVNGILYNKNQTKLIKCPEGKQGAVIMPNSVKSIDEWAFSDCVGLTSITLSNSITSIDNYVFDGCTGLSKIAFPSSVTSVGHYACYYCTGLASIIIPSSVTNIGNYAFSLCKSLTSIILPDSVTNIGDCAFRDCYNLKDVYYSGSKAQWDSANLGKAFSSDVNIHYNYRKPTITTQPMSQTINLGDTASFSLKANGSGLTYQWYYKKSGSSSFTAWSGKTNMSESFTPDSSWNGAQFYCVVKDGAGSTLTSNTVSLTVVNNSKPISDTTVTLSQTSYTYDGTAKKPTVTVKDGTKTLTSGTDYTVSYSNNTNVGTATVTVTGAGNYSGTTSKTFTISAKSISGTTVTLNPTSFIYDGTAKKPTVTVKDGTKTLASGTDYTVSYSNNTNVGTAKATVTGKGNYNGAKSVTFEIKPKPNKFTNGADNWNFYNSRNNFGNTYYMSEKYWNALLNGLSNTEKATLNKYVKNGSWGGSCYGMAVTSILASNGILKPSQYQSGATFLHDISAPPTNEVKSLINYYFALQYTDVIQQQISKNFYNHDEKAKLNSLIACLNDGSATLLCFHGYFYGYSWGGHAVVAYGVEYGTYSYNGKAYNGKILIYDNNNINFSDKFCLYFNSSNGSWMIPYYELDSTNGSLLGFISNDMKYVNYHGYLNGSSNITKDDYIAILHSAAITGNYSLKKAKLSNGVFTTTTTSDDDIKVFSSLVDNNFENSDLMFAMKDASSCYVLKTSSNENLDLALSYENSLLNAKANNATTAKFSPDSYVELGGSNMDYHLGIVLNDGYTVCDWYGFTVDGKNADKAVLQASNNGYILSASNLNNVSVTGYNDSVTAKRTFSTSYKKVFLYEIDKNTIGAAVDTDNNGTFETPFNLTITTQPTNKTVNLGESVTLSLKAQGSGLTYQWYYKKAGQTSFSAWNGRTHASETCTPNATWDGIQLYCIVKDSAGNSVKSNTITVSVKSGPVITKPPTNQTISLGSSVTLSLTATGTGLTYQWYFKKAGQTSFSAWNGRTHASETVTPNATWDGIQLYCIVKDSGGNSVKSNTVTVTVKSGPVITKQPTNQTISLGSSATLSLNATGSGLTYQWYYKKAGQTSFSTWNGRTHASETCTPNATWDGIQLYCIVKDSAGNKVQSNTVTVKVNSAGITITQQPQNQSIVVGTSINLTVKATGSSLKYQWYFKKKGQTSFNIWNGRTHATETVSPNSTWDGIQLYCKITDGSGKTLNSSTVTINVLSITTQPSNVTVAAGSNATFKVVATGSGLNYQWQYKKSGQTSWNNWGARTTASTTATSNATWQGMQVRCIVTDSAGNKVTSNAATITIK